MNFLHHCVIKAEKQCQQLLLIIHIIFEKLKHPYTKPSFHRSLLCLMCNTTSQRFDYNRVHEDSILQERSFLHWLGILRAAVSMGWNSVSSSSHILITSSAEWFLCQILSLRQALSCKALHLYNVHFSKATLFKRFNYTESVTVSR